MLNKEMYIMAFDSTHHAIRAEKEIKNENIDIKTIPTPREVTVSCGLSIKFDYKDLNRIKDIIDEYNLSTSGVYKIHREDGRRLAKKII